MTSDNVQALPPGTMLGDYRLDAVIGHGGFGITYRAFDSQLAKVVAIKEYLPVEFAVRDGDEGRAARRALRRRFRLGPRALPRRGAGARPLPPSAHRAGAALPRRQRHGLHRHGVRGRPQRRPSCCASPAGRLPPDEVRRLAEGLLLGLGAVHAQGFLHRDIKPSNIIIRRDGVPILIDFGAARQAMGNRTRTHDLGADAAICADRAVRRRRQAGAVERHLFRRRGAASRHRRRSRRPKRRAGSARIPTGRSSRRRPAVRPDVPGGGRSRPGLRAGASGRNRSRNGASCSACRWRAPTMRRRSAWSRACRSGRSDAAPRRRQSRDPRAARAAEAAPPRRSATPWILLALAVVVGAALWRYQAPLLDRVATLLPQGRKRPTARRAQASRRTVDAGADADPAALRHARADAVAPAVSPAQKELEEPGAARRARARARSSRRPRRPPTRRAPWRAKRASRPRAPRDRAWRMPKGSPADDGATYVGQVADGKRQGLGVLEFKDGDRQAGEWKDNVLNGLGTERSERRPAL